MTDKDLIQIVALLHGHDDQAHHHGDLPHHLVTHLHIVVLEVVSGNKNFNIKIEIFFKKISIFIILLYF
jgi:hypothetical protein